MNSPQCCKKSNTVGTRCHVVLCLTDNGYWTWIKCHANRIQNHICGHLLSYKTYLIKLLASQFPNERCSRLSQLRASEDKCVCCELGETSHSSEASVFRIRIMTLSFLPVSIYWHTEKCASESKTRVPCLTTVHTLERELTSKPSTLCSSIPNNPRFSSYFDLSSVSDITVTTAPVCCRRSVCSLSPSWPTRPPAASSAPAHPPSAPASPLWTPGTLTPVTDSRTTVRFTCESSTRQTR